jgi:hypothetical protein
MKKKYRVLLWTKNFMFGFSSNSYRVCEKIANMKIWKQANIRDRESGLCIWTLR